MTEPTANPVEVVLEYQPTDEQGNPIGKKTVIKGATWEEVARKQTEVNIQAIRAYNRLKTTTPQQKPVETARKPLSVDEEAQATYELLDPSKARKGLRTLMEAEFGISELQQEAKAGREARAALNRQRVGVAWAKEHPEYYDCAANGQMLATFLNGNNLEWTPENLDYAFASVQDQLAEKPTSAPPANPATRRPQAGPDVVPGSLNGAPGAKPKALTKADYLNMAKNKPDEWERHRTNTRLRAQMERILNPKSA